MVSFLYDTNGCYELTDEGPIFLELRDFLQYNSYLQRIRELGVEERNIVLENNELFDQKFQMLGVEQAEIQELDNRLNSLCQPNNLIP